MPRLVRSLILAGLVLAAAPTGAASAGRVDPRLRFRWLRTPHFTIYFHEGRAAMAARLAPLAEDTWAAVSMRLGLTPPAHTHVVLADQSDAANAWAFPLPFNTVLIHASTPSGAERIGRSTDWLRVVFTHKFTHIVHLDQSEGWARGLRRMFGRMPLAFPNLFLPEWMIEGLAAYEESVVTGEGRLGAGDFRAIEREAARAGRFLSLNRVNGGLVAWPAGEAPYAYGLGFHEFLVDRAGESSLGDAARRSAGRLAFFSTPAFADVYGEPLGSLWSQYRQVVGDGVRAAAQADRMAAGGRGVTRITTTGYAVAGPRFLGPACPGCPPEILYTMETPHALPSLEVAALDGTHRRLATRYGGWTVGISNDWVVFDQREIRRNAGLYNDLYLLSRRTGEGRVLSTEGRYADPDLALDGRPIVCVREGNGQRDLVVLSLEGDPPVRLGAPRVVIADPDTVFNAPRWSPDGRRVAVERHRRGRWSEVVVVDATSGTIEHVARIRDARVVTPT